MSTRIYLVSDGKKVRMVEAYSQSQALKHVSRGMFQVSVASGKQVASLCEQGLKVEKGVGEVPGPAPVDPEPQGEIVPGPTGDAA